MLQFPTFSSDTGKDGVANTLKTMHELWDNMGNTAHLFLGGSMICPDKTAAGIAAEIWLQYVVKGKINNAQLGKVIGLHERIEFAPLKRFTDLVSQQLFRVSDQHNRHLQTLISHILAELPEEPIRNLKKLLELYAELVSLNDMPISDRHIVDKLQLWQKSSSLQKPVEMLLKHSTITNS
jgi:hypothetical protein